MKLNVCNVCVLALIILCIDICLLKNINSLHLTTDLFSDTFSLRPLTIGDTVQQVSLHFNEYTTEFVRLVGDVVL